MSVSSVRTSAGPDELFDGTVAGELHDSSKVLQRSRPRHLALEVRFRPVGVARVDLDVADDDGGCVVTLTERPQSA